MDWIGLDGLDPLRSLVPLEHLAVLIIFYCAVVVWDQADFIYGDRMCVPSADNHTLHRERE